VQKSFGGAGARIVIQELLEGTEISLHALCDGKTARLFPTAQDHKRARDGDQGPNTGGMGTYSPTPFLNETQLAEVGKMILGPWLKGCAAEGIDFRGLLYPGVMLTKTGPKILEFNARFGDPETQVILSRLKTDLLEVLVDIAEHRLASRSLEWRQEASVTVVLVVQDYPGRIETGREIFGLDEAKRIEEVKVYHAGTRWEDGRFYTAGGRVLNVTARGATLSEALERAYFVAEMIEFDGKDYRKDIGRKGLLKQQ